MSFWDCADKHPIVALIGVLGCGYFAIYAALSVATFIAMLPERESRKSGHNAEPSLVKNRPPPPAAMGVVPPSRPFKW